MNATVNHMGETLPLGKLIAHYRMQARNNPRSADFWRQLMRTVIAQYREQQAEMAEQRKAA